MNSTELLDQFRSDVADQEDPPLWSDLDIFRYMDEAQKMFCRLTGGLGDATSLLTQLAYDGTTDWLDTSPLILYIREATDERGRHVPVMNMEEMRKHGLRFTPQPGRVKAIITGIEPNKVRLYGYPAEAGAFSLMVERLPLKSITDAGDQKLEIDEQHHVNLLMWMKHRAYSKQDSETFDRTKAAEFKAAFEAYCFDAKYERERARGKVRVVNYGGI